MQPWPENMYRINYTRLNPHNLLTSVCQSPAAQDDGEDALAWSSQWQFWDADWSNWSGSSWGSWSSNWGNYNWGWGQQHWHADDATGQGSYAALPQETAAEKDVSATVASILQRGHTVDRLTEAELQEVAKGIEMLQQQRAQKPAPATKAAGAADPSGGSGGSKEPQVAATEEAKLVEDNGGKKESKAERKKRLHARNMRYYRSFLSSSIRSCISLNLASKHVSFPSACDQLQ